MWRGIRGKSRLLIVTPDVAARTDKPICMDNSHMGSGTMPTSQAS